MRSLILGFGMNRLGAPRRRWRSRANNRVTYYLGVFMVAAFVLAGLVGPLWLRDPNQTSNFFLVHPGSHGFFLGTDQYGRDEFSRIASGIRTTLLIIAVSMACALVVGTSVGLVAARSRLFDVISMRVMDIFMAFPAILLAIGIMAMVGPGVSGVVEAITIVYIPIFARVTRAPALEQMSKEYVEAASVTGVRNGRLLFRHVLPNISHVIIVQLSVAVSDVILIEAALSYLGLGVLPPASSLGELLKNGQMLMFNAPWMVIYPTTTIAWAILGFNLLGDSLRDLLDVHL